MGALDGAADAAESGGEGGGSEGGDGRPDPGPGAANRAGTMRRRLLTAVLLLIAVGIVVPPLFAWQSENQQKALSLSNMRRVANGCLFYAEDWDERLPPPVQWMPDGFVLSWPRLVRPYVALDDAFSNPSNSVTPFAATPKLRDPADNRAIETSYALNRRFWGEFAPGPFPTGNLELPEQTALLVEAGRMAPDPRRPHFAPRDAPGLATDLYGDTTDRVHGLSPYPSTHGGQLGVIAADGHGLMGKVLCYSPPDGPHDRLLGRIFDTIYNWNGGHSNGETDTPPHE